MQRRLISLLAALVLLLSATVPALAAGPTWSGPRVAVNGQFLISLESGGPHIHFDRLYAAVADFAWLTGVSWSYSSQTGTLVINGQRIAYDWSPAPHFDGGDLFAPVRVMAQAVGGTVQWDPGARTAYVTFPGKTPAQMMELPRGVSRLGLAVPGVGERWADPGTLPYGPVYLVYNGAVIGWELEVSRSEIADGKSWAPVFLAKTGGDVDHVEVAYQPGGDDAAPFGHYDFRAYTISRDEQRRIR